VEEPSEVEFAPPQLVRPSTILPALREPILLKTKDGLHLIGEVASPISQDRSHAIVMLHPLPTHGGMMDSHLLKKAANRLPAMAGITVIRFNTRGTESEQGRSEGEFGGGLTEGSDVEAAISFALQELKVENLWVVGWSFGTDLAIKYARDPKVSGLILLSPPLRFSLAEDLEFWRSDGRPIIALVPEFDDFLQPEAARERFAVAPQAEVVEIVGGKHLWVGEPFVYRALTEIVKRVRPEKLPLPTTY
jgi:alpha/beta superfamily hydrolase